MSASRLLRLWPAAALAILIAYPVVYDTPFNHLVGFNIFLFASMAASWNILGGFCGYKSLGHAAFFGIGAYSVALAHVHWGWNPFWSAPVIALAVMVLALPLGWIMLRTTGSAFVIVTIAMLLIFRLIAVNWRSVTNGNPGLEQPIPDFSPENARLPFYFYMLGVMIFAVLVTSFIRRSRFGLGLLAIKNDEGKAEMVGVNTMLYKVLAFGLSAYFVALGGGIWSYFQTHISPAFAFDIIVGVNMILMVILGGLGTVWGPIVGAFMLILFTEYVINEYFGSSAIHLTVLGVMMLGAIIFLPRGLIPTIDHWLRRRRIAGSAFAGARSMEELRDTHERVTAASTDGSSTADAKGPAGATEVVT